MSVHGYCPICAAPGRTRERRPNGNDTCERGHVYPGRDALREPVLACPFCGSPRVDGSASIGNRTDGGPGKVIAAGCLSCGATGPDRHSKSEAIEAWNRRYRP
jgi:Lar family restriction alleviation protein